MKKSIIFITLILLIVLSFMIAFIFLNSINSIEHNGVTLAIDDIVGNPEDSIMYNENIYISIDYIKDNNLLDLFWDKDYNRISIFNNYKLIKITYNITEAKFNDIEYSLDEVLYLDFDKLYLNAEFVSKNLIDNMIVDKVCEVVYANNTVKEYKASENTVLKKCTSSRGGYDNIKVNKNDLVQVLCVYEDYALCKTQDGQIGYIDIDNIMPYRIITDKVYTKEKRRDSIVLAWDLVSDNTRSFEEFELPDVVEIIAPTWYSLVDSNDYFEDISSDEYTKYVQSNNKKLWATFTNSFDPELTNLMLNDAYKRSRIIDKIISITKEKSYDGINIDFENVYMKDRNVYSAFIKELYCKSKSENIILSVDVAVLSNSETWSKFLDRKEIGIYSDYVILMAYDENVSGFSGSVASLPWVEYGVENLLESVFEGKVVMAVPFYTRLWEEEYGEYPDGKPNVKSTSLKLSTAIKVLKELKIELSFDEKTGQNYGEKTIDGIRYRIWNEDTTSLQARLDIIKKYNLVGKGVWALSYGTQKMWDLLQ